MILVGVGEESYLLDLFITELKFNKNKSEPFASGTLFLELDGFVEFKL